jgi:hypothetical protein
MAPPRIDFPKKICAHCGAEFEPRRFNKHGHSMGQKPNMLYCSGHCRNLARNLKPRGSIHHSGYRYMSMGKRGDVRAEHRVMMERMIGRPLLSHETVHHKNGNRLDNRAENLELWSNRHGKGHRVADQIAFAKETLAIYGDGSVLTTAARNDAVEQAMLCCLGN